MFEYFMNKYKFYNEMNEKLMDMLPGEQESLVNYLLSQIKEYQIDIQTLYRVISNACEIKPILVNEYWMIYDKIYQLTNIKSSYGENVLFVEALFDKKYNSSYDWIGTYIYCKNKNFDEILSYYESDPIMHCILHDDVRSFIDIINSKSDFDFKARIFGRSLIENCCFCGSLECFRFLRSNGIEINKKCLDASILGRNKSIIQECVNSPYIDQDYLTMTMCMKAHNFELLMLMQEGYKIRLRSACEYLNLPVFFTDFLRQQNLTNF